MKSSIIISAFMAVAKMDAFYKAAYANAGEAHLKRINNSGHFIMLDLPERFAAAVEAFLSK